MPQPPLSPLDKGKISRFFCVIGFSFPDYCVCRPPPKQKFQLQACKLPLHIIEARAGCSFHNCTRQSFSGHVWIRYPCFIIENSLKKWSAHICCIEKSKLKTFQVKKNDNILYINDMKKLWMTSYSIKITLPIRSMILIGCYTK